MYNRIYNIFTLGAVTENDDCYRYSNASINARQENIIKKLLQNIDTQYYGIIADILIGVMRCSHHWPDFIKEYDPNNNYNLPTPCYSVKPDLKIIIDRLFSLQLSSAAFPVNKNMSKMEQIASKLFTIISMK